jgi:long-chain acyl-CoA synthetase
LFILGRAKHVINFAGMKVFPDEVEAVLVTHPAVADCRVHGVAHPLWGQIPSAKILLRAGMAEPSVNELRKFCFQRMAGHKVPKAYEFVDRLERTASGKMRRE